MAKRIADQLVETTLREALSFNGPALIHVYTNPDSLAMPPKLELEQLRGMASSMGKMMLQGDFKDVANIIKSNYKHLKKVF